MLAIQRFIRFYGPCPNEYTEHLKKEGKKQEPKVEFINALLSYYFGQRESLKLRSKLHEMILVQREREPTVKKMREIYRRFRKERLAQEEA